MKIQSALKNEFGDSTAILISHRITTLMQADKILVLDGGEVSETGTHDELIASGGIYSRVFQMQSAGEEWENE